LKKGGLLCSRTHADFVRGRVETRRENTKRGRVPLLRGVVEERKKTFAVQLRGT